jgi:hypothetical protein
MSTAAEDPVRRQGTEGSIESESHESASSMLGAFRVCVSPSTTLRRRAVDTSVDVDEIPRALAVPPPPPPPPPPHNNDNNNDNNNSNSNNNNTTTVEVSTPASSIFRKISSFWSTSPARLSSSPRSSPSSFPGLARSPRRAVARARD